MNKILKIYQNVENSLSYLLSNNCDEKKFLKEKFKNKKIIFLDLGSNLGTYTDLINKNLKMKKIYIFEPSKICFKFLQEKYKNRKIYIFNKALSDKKKILNFMKRKLLLNQHLIIKKIECSIISKINLFII